MKVRLVALAVAAAAVSPAAGQSFNIDFGQPGAGPPPSYAAAGRPGFWISVPGTQGVTVFNLVDVEGSVTAARFSQFGGTETLLVGDHDPSGDDATLMNDFLITHTAIENCLFFDGLAPGTYEVIIYARMPAQPGVLSLTNVDQETGNPHHLVGGAWPGGHVEFITYALHTAEVAATGPSAGKLGLHSGVPAGGNFAIGAALNGVQIHKLEPLPEDINGDCAVNVLDLIDLLLDFGTPGGPADINADGSVNVLDLIELLLAFGTTC